MLWKKFTTGTRIEYVLLTKGLYIKSHFIVDS
jgi:hypothetical protein